MTKKTFLRQRRKGSMELANVGDLTLHGDASSSSSKSSADDETHGHRQELLGASESEDGFVSPATKAKVEKSLWASAKKRIATRQQSSDALLYQASPLMGPLGSPSRPETLSTNAFRAAQGNEAVEDMLLFREKPRQLAVLFAVVTAVSYYSYTHNSDDLVQNVRTGLSSGVLIFLVYCFLQTRDGLMVRPHPGVWRIVHGCSVVYLVLLAAISVQNRRGAITSMQFFFPEVGKPKKMTSLGAKLDCEINGDTVYRGVSSIWFLAHVTGWWGKMCMFRDWRFCWVLSIAFEILELTLQFVIPDFQECWWDSMFMDLLGANLLGMILGRITLGYFETKFYDWSGKKEKRMGALRFALSQFTPISWMQYDWEVFSNFKRFASVMFALIVCLAVELNAFFLLNTLSVPKESNFNAYRLALMFLIGIHGAAEYYEFLSNPECRRLGQNAWMILSIASFEVLVWVKFSPGVLFTTPPPPQVLYPIMAFLAMFSVWMVLFFSTARPPTPVPARRGSSKPWSNVAKWRTLDVLFWLSFAPLLVLTTQWAY